MTYNSIWNVHARAKCEPFMGADHQWERRQLSRTKKCALASWQPVESVIVRKFQPRGRTFNNESNAYAATAPTAWRMSLIAGIPGHGNPESLMKSGNRQL